MEEKLEVGESRVLTKKDINNFVWKDKKVIVLSNVYGGQMINKRRYDGTKWVNIPNLVQLIEEYKLRTQGVDRANQKVSYYHYNSNARWYKKVFYYLMEVCLKNAHILHEQSCRKNSIVPMQLEVSVETCRKYD